MRHGWKESGLDVLLRAERMKGSVPYVLGHTAAALLEQGDEPAARDRVRETENFLGDLKVELRVGPDELQLYSRWENPLFAKRHILLADVLAVSGDTRGAEAELRLGNSRYPGHNELMVDIGRFFLATGRTDDALHWLSGAIGIDPHSPGAHFELSFVHAENGEFESALEDLRAAVSLRPVFPDYRYFLGTLLRHMEQTDATIDELQRALTLNPTYDLAAIQLARQRPGPGALGAREHSV